MYVCACACVPAVAPGLGKPNMQLSGLSRFWVLASALLIVLTLIAPQA